MILPNFLIVGAQKSGTTSLYHYLKSHPQIFLSDVKEPNYFPGQGLTLPQNGPKDKNIKYILDWEDYLKLFRKAEGYVARGEASIETMYFYKNTIPLIQSRLGDPKILIFLRNPVERAYSAYTHLLREGEETRSFEEALDLEEERVKSNWRLQWHLKHAGLYYEQVKAFQENFSRVGIWLFEDVAKKTSETVKQIYDFLDVDSGFVAPNQAKVFNQSGVPKSMLLSRFFAIRNPVQEFISKTGRFIMTEEAWIRFRDTLRNSNLQKSKMDPHTRQKLVDYFREDITSLANIINRDLSHWLR